MHRLPLEQQGLHLGEERHDFWNDALELLLPEERIEVGGRGRDREARDARDEAQREDNGPLPERLRKGVRPAATAVVAAPEDLHLRKNGRRVGNAFEESGERDAPPGLAGRERRDVPGKPVGGLEHGGDVLSVVSKQQPKQRDAEGVEVARRAEVREDAVAGPRNLRAEREAEAALAVLLEREEIAREPHLVRADLAGCRPDGEAGEAEVERRVRDRQEERVPLLRRWIEAVRVGDAATKAEAPRSRPVLVEVREDELARPVSGQSKLLDLGRRGRNRQSLPGQDDRRGPRGGQRHGICRKAVDPGLERPEERKAVAGPRELEEEVAGVEVEVRAPGGPVIVEEAFENLAERGHLQEEDLDGIEAGALRGEEEPARRRRSLDEPRPAPGKRPARPAPADRELLPGPTAERVGERFEVEGCRDGHEEGRPEEGQRRAEVTDAGLAGHVRGPEGARRLRRLDSDEGRGLLLRENLAKRVAQVVEKIGGGAHGRARRGDLRRRVDGRRSGSVGAGLAPEEALSRRSEGREAGAREPCFVTAERERIPAAGAGGN